MKKILIILLFCLIGSHLQSQTFSESQGNEYKFVLMDPSGKGLGDTFKKLFEREDFRAFFATGHTYSVMNLDTRKDGKFMTKHNVTKMVISIQDKNGNEVNRIINPLSTTLKVSDLQKVLDSKECYPPNEAKFLADVNCGFNLSRLYFYKGLYGKAYRVMEEMFSKEYTNYCFCIPAIEYYSSLGQQKEVPFHTLLVKNLPKIKKTIGSKEYDDLVNLYTNERINRALRSLKFDENAKKELRTVLKGISATKELKTQFFEYITKHKKLIEDNNVEKLVNSYVENKAKYNDYTQSFVLNYLYRLTKFKKNKDLQDRVYKEIVMFVDGCNQYVLLEPLNRYIIK